MSGTSPEPSLAEIQRVLGELLRHPRSLRAQPEALAGIVREGVRLSASAQAEIYREQFWLRHIGAIREDMPGLVHLLDEPVLEAFLRAYFTTHPPDSWTLRDAGNRLPAFAASYEGFPEGQAEVAREMVRWESAFIDPWDRSDLDPIGLEAVEALPPEAWVGARLSFRRTLTVMCLAYPVHEVRQAVREGHEAPRTLGRRPVRLALWRNPQTLSLQHRTLGEEEHRLLEAMRQGAALGEACERVAAAFPGCDLSGKLAGWFRGWARRGWIVGLETT